MSDFESKVMQYEVEHQRRLQRFYERVLKKRSGL